MQPYIVNSLSLSHLIELLIFFLTFITFCSFILAILHKV